MRGMGQKKNRTCEIIETLGIRWNLLASLKDKHRFEDFLWDSFTHLMRVPGTGGILVARALTCFITATDIVLLLNVCLTL